MTTDENASDWRDLAANLPAAEQAALYRLETELTAGGVDPGEVAGLLLEFARDAGTGPTVDTLCADIPAPPGVTVVGEWERNTAGGCSRSLLWARYGDPHGISVDVHGRQEHDGTYTRQICVWGLDEGGTLDAAAARQLAADLLAAADLIDG